MTTNLVDVENVLPNTDGLFEQLKSENEAPPSVEAPVLELPPKFKGKHLEDVVRSYEELEKQYGKQGQELGELRKLADEMIKRQLNGNPNSDNFQSNHNDSTELDILQDPNKGVERLIEQKLSPALKEIAEYKKEKMTNKLNDSHPDFLDIVKDLEFQEWVKTSRVRLELFQMADQGFDYQAADELFSNWKNTKGIPKKERASREASNNDEAYRNASMETGAAQEQGPKKKYRRADIMQLKLENPERYSLLQPEIMRAYAEGRVV